MAADNELTLEPFLFTRKLQQKAELGTYLLTRFTFHRCTHTQSPGLLQVNNNRKKKITSKTKLQVWTVTLSFFFMKKTKIQEFQRQKFAKSHESSNEPVGGHFFYF